MTEAETIGIPMSSQQYHKRIDVKKGTLYVIIYSSEGFLNEET